MLSGSGIRVSELKFITVEAVAAGITEINNKGKVRNLYISTSLCELLSVYCDKNNIKEGIIFTGRKEGSHLSASAIWRKINNLSKETGIDRKKLFPHNLRHFYASRFMDVVSNINVLSGLLGHTDIKTTTIYTHPDGAFIRQCVDRIIA